jgi:hypothetical protein
LKLSKAQRKLRRQKNFYSEPLFASEWADWSPPRKKFIATGDLIPPDRFAGIKERTTQLLGKPARVDMNLAEKLTGKKLSETLIEFCQPLLDVEGTDTAPDTLRKIFELGSVAWNLALFLPEKRKKIMAEMFPDISNEEKDILLSIIRPLMERKESLFRNNRLLIVNTEVQDLGDSVNVLVSSIPFAEGADDIPSSAQPANKTGFLQRAKSFLGLGA